MLYHNFEEQNMMKKSYIFSIIALFVFVIAGCKEKQAKSHSHSYDFSNPQWVWEVNENGGYTAKATLTCTGCEETSEGHSLVLNANVSSTIINPTCESNGSITYIATATFDKNTITDRKTDSLQKLGHQFDVLVVEGDFRKTYNALESFDLSNLVVKAICSRSGCGEEITLNQDEYFVIYQTQGADHLCAGDTKVTISASYAPFASFEITGLTVTKIPNSINGFENSYSTTCCVAPDLSGVSALSNDLEIKYFSDSNCSVEVALNNLDEGNYYIKASAGDINHEVVTKVATLEVSHAFNQCAEEPIYLKSAATAFANATYYKSCLCGAHSTSLENVFVSSGSKLPYVVASSAFDNYTAASLDVPEGYNAVTKSTDTYDASQQNHAFLANLDSSDTLEKITFMILTKNNGLCQNDWSGSSALQVDKWYPVEIIKNQDSTYSSTIKDENGVIKIQYLNKTYSEVLPYYQYGDQPTTEIYSTEVYGVRSNDETFNQLVSESSVSDYTLTNIVSPKGYQTVTLNNKTFNDSDQNKTFLKTILLDGYQSVSFAFKTKNRHFCDSHWGNPCAIDTWHTCTFERNSNDTFNCIIATMNGVIKFTNENVTSFKEGLLYYNWDGSAPNLEWYSTEVRGVAL